MNSWDPEVVNQNGTLNWLMPATLRTKKGHWADEHQPPQKNKIRSMDWKQPAQKNQNRARSWQTPATPKEKKKKVQWAENSHPEITKTGHGVDELQPP